MTLMVFRVPTATDVEPAHTAYRARIRNHLDALTVEWACAGAGFDIRLLGGILSVQPGEWMLFADNTVYKVEEVGISDLGAGDRIVGTHRDAHAVIYPIVEQVCGKPVSAYDDVLFRIPVLSDKDNPGHAVYINPRNKVLRIVPAARPSSRDVGDLSVSVGIAKDRLIVAALDVVRAEHETNPFAVDDQFADGPELRLMQAARDLIAALDTFRAAEKETDHR